MQNFQQQNLILNINVSHILFAIFEYIMLIAYVQKQNRSHEMGR